VSELPSPPPRFGQSRRGVRAIDVEQAAEALLRAGERPTIEKVRKRLGSGSPNTINPLLDTWWKKIGGRLQTKSPAALERVPELVAHVAEALWLQALEEGRRRAQAELSHEERRTTQREQAIEVQSHVLTLREGELASRLHDRDQRIANLELTLRETNLKLRTEEATNASLQRQLLALSQDLQNLASRRQELHRKKTRAPRNPRPRAKKSHKAKSKRSARSKKR
jgi:Plasmid replication region DNA-binding N-term